MKTITILAAAAIATTVIGTGLALLALTSPVLVLAACMTLGGCCTLLVNFDSDNDE